MTKLAMLLLMAETVAAQTPGTIQTVVGTGSAMYSGDGGRATSASINTAVDIQVDRTGNLFIADQFNHRIRKVTPNGTITTVAGNGTAGFSGDGGPATSAQINTPTGVCLDQAGVLYIAEPGNQRVRRMTTDGTITTLAGNGAKAFGGDGGPATGASLYNAVRCAVDASGNVLIADQSNHRIRKVDASGTITTFAGNGAGTPATGTFSGDGTPAASAGLNNPTALCIDNVGNVYIADQFNHRIRKVAGDGTITTIAGTGSAGFGGDNGPAINALLNYPGAVAVDGSGNVYFNDDVNYRTRMVSSGGTISTIAGNGSQGFGGDGGPATSAMLNGNFGVSTDATGNVYIADSMNHRIRVIYGAVPGQTPVVSAASFTNAASFVSGGSPGAIATLFGQHLSRNVSGFVLGSGIPLPSTVAGTSITIDGKAAPIFSVANQGGTEQVSFQIPVDASTGAPVPVTVNNGFASAAISVPLTQAQPGVFTTDGTNATAVHADFSLVTSAHPAAKGETIIVFCTGLGAVNPPVAAGTPASGTVLSISTATFTATVGGESAPVSFSGLAPGFIGLGQINLAVPGNAASGPQDLVISGAGSVSKAVKVSVQ